MAKKAADEMNFFEHLEELRWHFIRAIVAVIIAAILTFLAKGIVFDKLLLAPLDADFFTNRLLAQCGFSLNMPDLQINKQALDLQNIKLSGQLGIHVTEVLLLLFLMFSTSCGVLLHQPYIERRNAMQIQPFLWFLCCSLSEFYLVTISLPLWLLIF